MCEEHIETVHAGGTLPHITLLHINKDISLKYIRVSFFTGTRLNENYLLQTRSDYLFLHTIETGWSLVAHVWDCLGACDCSLFFILPLFHSGW